MENLLFKSYHIGEVTEMEENAGIVKGYASVFGNVDSDGDIIRRGAYKKTIQENKSRIKYLYQHDMDKPLGKMRHLEEDSKGLMFEAIIPETQLGKDVVALIKAGVITENSVGILPIQKEMNGDTRELTEVKLFEISAVTLAANEQALIMDVKSEKGQENVLKRYDALAKLIRKGKISDDMGYAIEAEILKLKSLMSNIITLPDQTTKPNLQISDSNVYSYLTNYFTNGTDKS